MARRDTSSIQFDAVRIEGALIVPDVVAKVASGKAEVQSEDSYGLLPGLKLRDEIGRFYQVARTLWNRFETGRRGQYAEAAHRTFATELLTKVLGFELSDSALPRGTKTFGLFTAKNGSVPIVVAGAQGLDKPESVVLGGNSVRRSATTALQGELNANPRWLWGLATDGNVVRLLRDSASLTRPAMIEIDVDQIFRDDLYSDFTLFWLLAHESRFAGAQAAPTESVLEQWRAQGREEGVAARGRLRDGVELALYELANGFLEHPDNADLRARLRNSNGARLPVEMFFRQLLRTVYRLIFVLTAEDRGVLFAPDADEPAKLAYLSGYSLARLRNRCRLRSAWDRHHDSYEGVKVLLTALASGERRLGLPALGGLFEPAITDALNAAKISNRRFLAALFHITWLKDAVGLLRINWRDMETEEFGSVYESLLELVPALTDDCSSLYFVNGIGDTKASGEAIGHQRKVTSSYYTKVSLVEFLLDSALDPAIENAVAENPDNPNAPLRVRVLDAACGSGHFILAAARRIARRLADLRNPGAASISEYRHALREVVAHCIYGVDRNELAVELCRVALWIEAVDPGRPLTFLDAKIRHGDSLIGVSRFDVLQLGVPDAAYATLDGDEKEAASYYRSLNKKQRDEKNSAQHRFEFALSPAELADAVRTLDLMPEDTLEEINAKAGKFRSLQEGAAWSQLRTACDLWTAAFFMPKIGKPPKSSEQANVPTTDHVWSTLRGMKVNEPLRAAAEAAAAGVNAFHWPLMFPDVMSTGGFDVVLGNPPWDTMSPDVKEFFDPYDPQIRFMSPGDQKIRVEELKRVPGVREAWDAYSRALYLAARFMKESGRYSMFAEGNLGKGDFNVYRMFVEMALRTTKKGGYAAQFVPENLYNGANAAAIRAYLFDRTKLERLVGFENTKRVWFDIDSRAKFCLYAAIIGESTQAFGAAFGVNSESKLQNLKSGLPITIPVALVKEFSPDALAVAEVLDDADVAICRKIYARYDKFGHGWRDPDFRPYSRELDMGNDRDTFGNDPDGIPVYEGRMVEAYDHRAKRYVSGRGRRAVWEDLSFREKGIFPQWRLSPDEVPQKIGERWLRTRAGFCDVASPTNQRAFVAALIPPNTVCGDKVPTVLLEDHDPRAMLLWIGVANSFAMDFIVRKKVGLKMSFTLVDSLPLPKVFEEGNAERAVARRALRLAATGSELHEFYRAAAPLLAIDPDSVAPLENPEERSQAKTEVDVLVARDIFALTKKEMNYLLDPADILGPDCGFETFGALSRAETREFGSFASKLSILKRWDDSSLGVDPEDLPDGAWIIPASAQTANATSAILAALLKAVPGPTPASEIRLAALCALEPKYLDRRLSESGRRTWRRLVGYSQSAPGSVTSFVPRTAAHWRDATTLLLGTKAIIDDSDRQTWAPGPGLDQYYTNSWPDGRARFVLTALNRVDQQTVMSDLEPEARMWVHARAA